MVMSEIRKWCCGPDGLPDFDKMMAFMNRHDRSGRYDIAGWAIFFIWVGVAWLADVGIGVGLLGVAAITLGMQGLRKVRRVPVERFWVLVGIGFAIAGFWQWSDFQKPLAPFILIAAGVGLLVWKTLPRSRHRGT
jgi:hypothetical protein